MLGVVFGAVDVEREHLHGLREKASPGGGGCRLGGDLLLFVVGLGEGT